MNPIADNSSRQGLFSNNWLLWRICKGWQVWNSLGNSWGRGWNVFLFVNRAYHMLLVLLSNFQRILALNGFLSWQSLLLSWSIRTVVDDTWIWGRSSRWLTDKHELILNQIAKFVHKLLISFLLMNSLSAFHSLSDKCVSSVQHHPLRECQFRLSFWFQIHSEIVKFVELISIFLKGFSLRWSLFKNVLLRIKKDIEVTKVEPLIEHLLNLFLSFGREFSSINILAFFGVIINLRATLICVTLALFIRSHIILQKRGKYFLNNSWCQCLIFALSKSREEWA